MANKIFNKFYIQKKINNNIWMKILGLILNMNKEKIPSNKMSNFTYQNRNLLKIISNKQYMFQKIK